MKRFYPFLLFLGVSLVFSACAPLPPDRYNTQRGAVIGAGTGALIGQAIGRNTEGTLIGLAAGTILGALVGNAADQDYQAARDAARYGKPVIFYDENGRAVEAIPEGTADSSCRTVRKRVWEDGKLVKETVEEICGAPPPPVPQYAYPPPPPPPAYYGWWGWPLFPSFSFYYGGPYYRSHFGYRPYRHYPHRPYYRW